MLAGLDILIGLAITSTAILALSAGTVARYDSLSGASRQLYNSIAGDARIQEQLYIAQTTGSTVESLNASAMPVSSAEMPPQPSRIAAIRGGLYYVGGFG